MKLFAGIPLILALAWTSPAVAEDLPAGLTDLLREASPKERQTIEDVAKRLYPQERQAIDDLVDRIEKEEEIAVGKISITQGWTGEGSLGGNYSSGNTNKWEISLTLDIKREGPRWEHRIDADLDIGDVDDERNVERVTVGYRPRRDLVGSPFFLFGVLRYERDRFSGIDQRFTQSIGPGYKLIDKGGLDWDVYAGPALRQTAFSDGHHVDQFGAFIGTDLEWDITHTLTLTQYAGAVLAKENKSVKTTTALTSNLYGELSARIDFTFEKETDPPVGSVGTDKFSRVSIVYHF
jgi:putative salt-induced outer membrane protein